MAPASPTPRNEPTEDELDSILNGIIDGENVFDTSNIQPDSAPSEQRKAQAMDSGLGIEEEIKIVKKRQPIPKLDEDRLLSAAGIPKLRRISKERLRFKGKGHEYGDIARMLNMYQLWLDDLYPRAKFADGLAMIEKLGHTKRIQYMRKEWIDEGKPKNTIDMDQEDEEQVAPIDTIENSAEQMEGVQTDTARGIDEAQGDVQAEPAPQTVLSVREDPDEDELDMLLAEGMEHKSSMTSGAAVPPNVENTEEDMFADEMEAMAGMW